jgi:ASPIC and UnbV
VSQPLNREHTHPQLGELDEEAGEFWIGNPFDIAAQGENLSAYERNRLYLNVDGKSFVDSSFASDADIDSDSRSVIATDFNGDGAIDLLVGSVGGGPLRLFVNRIPQSHRLKLTLEGVVSNRFGIGTRIVARAGNTQFVRDAFPVNGFMGQGPAFVDLGVGQFGEIDELTIRWPTGKLQVFNDVDVSLPLHVVELDTR